MIIKPFKKEHLLEMAVQPQQVFMKPHLLTPGFSEALEREFSFTGFEGERVVACAGLLNLWEGCARAWAILTLDIGGHGLLAVHKAIKRVLDVRTERRIEAEVDTSFEAGHRWIKMLGGFEWEGTMRKYTPDGRDCDRYARVQ